MPEQSVSENAPKPNPAGKKDLEPNLEVPKHTTLINLPYVPASYHSEKGKPIQLNVHTDTFGTIIKILKNLPEKDSIKIEGRILSKGQTKALLDDPVYKFFQDGRIVRAKGWLMRSDLGISDDQARQLLSAAHKPQTLAQKIGYQVGYFDASSLIYQDFEGANRGNLLPILGGVNAFRIGSDSLMQDELDRIGAQIAQGVSEYDAEVRSTLNSYPSTTPGFTFVQPDNIG